MLQCPRCTNPVPEASKFCGECGSDVTSGSDLTRTSLSGPGRARSTGGPRSAVSSAGVGRLSVSDSLDDGRFIPGAMLGGRYRIVGLLGRGGMGEVYRADDLKLGQPVALKFLPRALEQDPQRLARFLNEVRVARQVSHANVCRVYDVGELSEGTELSQHYLSMEFVNGEDLSTLLRRIGRISADKAVQIARQICAGLAAAHAKGIVHRDLKPANVMLDAQGQVRLTDFGLAGLAAGFEGAEIRVGTPAYMSPEQLAGTEVTLKSDIYSLGLVLYELFTGRAAYDAPTLAELLRQQQEATPSTPSTVVPDLDPAVERVIQRCMERDPARRPESALAVAAALPGGDPLAAALEAGETPSPEMVASAGEEGGLRPAWAVMLLGLILAGMIAVLALSADFVMARRFDWPKPPLALASDARELLQRLGYAERPADRDFGIDLDGDYLTWVEKHDRSPGRWERLGSIRPSPAYYWHRESPRPLVAMRAAGPVSFDNPPMAVSGMTRLRLDPRGRLLEFLAVPPQHAEPVSRVDPADWQPLFDAAGLQADRLNPVEPSWNPLIDCDERMAWDGTYPGQAEPSIRVEAGAYRGKPVYFEVIPPWTEPPQSAAVTDRAGVAANALAFSLLGLIIVGAILLARRNLKRNRCDRRGAFRMAGYMLFMALGAWALGDHVSSPAEIVVFGRAVQAALMVAGMVWLFYLAIEPYVRRLWPHALISWSRLLTGRFTDPRVGRDLLVGSLAGTGIMIFLVLTRLVPGWVGDAPQQPITGSIAMLANVRLAGSTILGIQINALLVSISIFFLIFLARWLLKREWAAVGVVLALMTTLQGLQTAQQGFSGWVGWFFAAAAWALILLVITRLGLLAGVITFVYANTLSSLPLTTDFSTWYWGRSWGVMLLLVGVAAYGFYTSLAGRPMFRDTLLD